MSESLFDDVNTVTNSGVFLCKGLWYQAAEISSPFVKSNAPLETVYYDEGVEVPKYVSQMKAQPGVFPMKLDVVREYGARVIEISRIIKESQYDVVLCPWRGARLPGTQGDLICFTEPFEAFNGADMGQGLNEKRICSDLRNAIFGRPKRSEWRKIGVLDTAKGGDSCRELAKLLGKVHQVSAELWDVHFHLIHAEGRPPPRAVSAYNVGSKTLRIQIHYHEVIDLLIEDEPALLGYTVEPGKAGSSIRRFQQEGQIMVYSVNSVNLLRKAPLDETMIALLSKEIMDQIQEMPDITPVDLHTWPYGA